MSYLAFGSLLQDARNNDSALDQLERSIRRMRKHAKDKKEARKYHSMQKALRLVRVSNSQS